jgi:hypothetical protein
VEEWRDAHTVRPGRAQMRGLSRRPSPESGLRRLLDNGKVPAYDR